MRGGVSGTTRALKVPWLDVGIHHPPWLAGLRRGCVTQATLEVRSRGFSHLGRSRGMTCAGVAEPSPTCSMYAPAVAFRLSGLVGSPRQTGSHRHPWEALMTSTPRGLMLAL